MSEIKVNVSNLELELKKLSRIRIEINSSNLKCPTVVGGGTSIQEIENIGETYKLLRRQTLLLITKTVTFLHKIGENYTNSDNMATEIFSNISALAVGVTPGAVEAIKKDNIDKSKKASANLDSSGSGIYNTVNAVTERAKSAINQTMNEIKEAEAERIRQEQAMAEAKRQAEWNYKLEKLREDPIFQQGNTYWKTGSYFGKDGQWLSGQCMAFAREAQERLYENYVNTGGNRFPISSVDEVQIGDALHYASAADYTDPYWGHWVLVIGKTESGNLIIAEGNAGNAGIVNWNREIETKNIDKVIEVIRPT